MALVQHFSQSDDSSCRTWPTHVGKSMVQTMQQERMCVCDTTYWHSCLTSEQGSEPRQYASASASAADSAAAVFKTDNIL